MILDGTQRITVAAQNADDSRILLAAITEAMVRNIVTRHDREIVISMRAKGAELLFGAEDTQEELVASSRAADFALGQALQNPAQVPDSMELSVRFKDWFCGRIHFGCFLPDSDIAEFTRTTDTVLILLDTQNTDQKQEHLISLVKDADAGISFVIQCHQPPSPDNTPEAWLKKEAPYLYDLAQDRMCAYQWYNPYGFQPDGTPNSADNAVPFGAEALFWDTMHISASLRSQFLQQKAEEMLRIIRSRNSMFQKDSVRRRLELDHARANYAAAVQHMYGAEHLLSVTDGTPFPEEAR